MVDDIWEARLQSGDPLENLLHKTEVGAAEVHTIGRRQQKTQGGYRYDKRHREWRFCRARTLWRTNCTEQRRVLLQFNCCERQTLGYLL